MGRGLALLKLISTAPRANLRFWPGREGLMTPTQQTQAESHLGSGEPVVSGAAVEEGVEASALVICTLVLGAPEGPRPVRLADNLLD